MPELPEVETTCRGINQPIMHKIIKKIIVRQKKLRYLIPPNISSQLKRKTISSVKRRGKYIIISTNSEMSIIIHLGMSGRLRVLPSFCEPSKHDHVDILFDDNVCLRYTDPRRFGAILITDNKPEQHELLKDLGPEPLSKQFNDIYLFKRAKRKKTTIKQFIMDSKIVVGVGNIYACEALFLAGISPFRLTNEISLAECATLSTAIKTVLKKAIQAGGTTLKDYYSAEGKPGFFQQKLYVYGRSKEYCHHCRQLILKSIISQRSTFYCQNCQK